MIRQTWSGARAKAAREVARDGSEIKPEEVADLLGVHRSSVYGWEAGREPQMRHVLALAALYGVSAESLFVPAHRDDGTTDGADGAGSEQETPANTDALAAVVPGVISAGSREGALTQE